MQHKFPLIIQQTGLSGAGKSTLSNLVADKLRLNGYQACILDGDEFRKTESKDLGYSKIDRLENIKRMGLAASKSGADVVIICAINPYQEGRVILQSMYHAHLVWIYCPLKTLISRDTKDFYRRALLPNGNPDKMYNLTGLGGEFDKPLNPKLIIKTNEISIEACCEMLEKYIVNQLIQKKTLA